MHFRGSVFQAKHIPGKAYFRQNIFRTKRALQDLWRVLLVREFHDILPGTSIQRVNEEAYEAVAGVEQESRLLSEKLLRLLAGGEAVFNSLSWERTWKGIALPPCGYV